MDRDIAVSMVEKMAVLNTALAKLSQYTLPEGVTLNATRLRLDPEEVPEVEPVTEPAESPEPVPETTTTRKKSTNK